MFCRGKRSVQCDPATPSGRLELIDLLGAVDVFVEDGGPGRANEAGYGFEQIHALLPGLVYCSLSSFGPEHAHRGLPPHEALVHAFVGTMAEQMGFREGPDLREPAVRLDWRRPIWRSSDPRRPPRSPSRRDGPVVSRRPCSTEPSPTCP